MSNGESDWNVGTSVDFDIPVIQLDPVTEVSSEVPAAGTSVDGPSVVNGSSSNGSSGNHSPPQTKGAMAWNSLKNVFSRKRNVEQKVPTPTATWDSLEGADAELCILYFQRGLNYRGLKNRLKSADHEWIEDFLDRDGLVVIFNALSGLGKRGISSMTEALDQLHCVAAVKEVMNRPAGLEYVIEGAGRQQIGSLMLG